ncbi:MAG: protease complex subunit PrcB family protein [Clostridia bacterium]|nr:protease complex subunit PrcB family protein [Clostridia bacterium]
MVEENGKVYIVVGAGSKSTDGYSIEIVDVHINGTEVVLDVQQTVPAKTAIVNKVTNYPTAVIEMNGKPTKITLNKLPDKTADTAALTWKKSDKVIEYKSSGYKVVEENGKVYIVVGAGTKYTDGYSIDVVDVHFNGTEAVIDTQQTVPAATQTVNKVTNYPTCVIELNGKPTKVTLNKLADKVTEAQALT